MSNPNDPPHPPWLKALQNGAIGETRSKAFLLDRFWVLERSVDIQGADMIIQRRLTNRNLLDRDAPKMGYLQAKFFGTQNTSHYVHKEYVLDQSGSPRGEFFLLCHYGDESSQRMFLLTSNELHEEFELKAGDDCEKYYVPWSKVSGNGKYEIKDRKLSLDRIENQLKCADFISNRRFISWALPSVSSDVDGIIPEYREPLDNDWGDIPEEFQKLKSNVRSVLYRLEEAYELISPALEKLDPLEAEPILLKFRKEYGDSVSFYDDYYIEDFFHACKRHRRILSKLQSEGLRDAFLKLRADISREVMKCIEGGFPLDSDVIQKFVVHYDPVTFSLIEVQSSFSTDGDFEIGKPELSEDEKKAAEESILDQDTWEICLGKVATYWRPGAKHYTGKDNIEDFDRFSRYRFDVFRRCMERIYGLKYGEEDLW